jgi:hypothetical protein
LPFKTRPFLIFVAFRLKEKARKRKGRGFGGGRRGADSDAEGDYDRLVIYQFCILQSSTIFHAKNYVTMKKRRQGASKYMYDVHTSYIGLQL